MHTLFLILAILIWASGCNSLFYYPDTEIYFTPDPEQVSFSNLYVEVDKKGTKVHQNSKHAGDDYLHVWHFKTSKKKKGTVLFFHGNAQNLTSHTRSFLWIVDRGYDLISFDYRGYGESKGELTRAATVEDGHTMLSYLSRIKGRKAVIAQSLGGAVALTALAQKRYELDRVVIDSSFGSYRDIAQDKLASFFLTWPFQIPLRYLVSDELSPNDYADQIKYDITVVHGTKDYVIPFKFGSDLANNLALTSHVKFIPVLRASHIGSFNIPGMDKCLEQVLSDSANLSSCHTNLPALIKENGGN